MEDKMLTCIGCKEQFVFTAGEQSFFEQKGFEPPKRCKTCRDKRKQTRSDEVDNLVGHSH